MNFTSIIIINIYSIIILTLILIHALKHVGINFTQHKLYLMLLQTTILLLFVDIFSRFDGNPGTIYHVINYLGNFLIYLLNPVLPSLWLLYAHYQVFHDENKLKPLRFVLAVINGANLILLISSQFFGWFYYIDIYNIYHRGPLFWVSASIPVVLTLASFVLIIGNYKKIEKRHFFSLLFFAVTPFICIILQIVFYGISILLNSITISLLIVFFNIQTQGLNTDYLTGVYNRKKLETYLKAKINMSTENITFSAVLIDLNNFKSINDTFGHDIGDDALETSITLIKSCVRPNDFIARFGGDEFYIILEVSNMHDLESTVARINNCIEKYNESGKKAYKLGVSMGYAVYDYHSHLSAQEFQKEIDVLMYENKRSNKEMKKGIIESIDVDQD